MTARDEEARVRETLKRARRMAVLTGSGISSESGIPTFRDSEGLWQEVRLEDVATPEGFADPEGLWRWYDARRRELARAGPNPGHRALAILEGRMEAFTLITQNVDRLHQGAGSRNVLELHGSIWDLDCGGCGARIPDHRDPLPDLPPRCPDCGGLLRPAVVWFGEALPAGTLARSAAAAREAEVFLSVGTSAEVEPAAALPRLARENGALLVEVNPDPTGLDADVRLSARAGEVLPRLIP